MSDELTYFQTYHFTEWNALVKLAESTDSDISDYLVESYQVLRACAENPPPGSMRKGQHAFNLLAVLRPGIANVLRGSRYDPFYRDSVLPEFWAEVEELWLK